MDNLTLNLLSLVNSSLKQEPSEIVLTKEMYKIAKENGLSGTLFPALKKEIQESDVYSLVQKDYYEFISKDTVQMQAIEDLTSLFEENHIEHIFLKGSVLKKVYPASYMRSMGDIDFLVTNEKMNLVHQVLEESGYINWSNSKAHDCFHKNRQVFLEAHPTLNSDFDDAYKNLFKDVWSTCTSEGYVYKMNHETEITYLLFHMVKHLSSSGIGLRNILDLSLYLEKYDSEISVDYLYSLLEKAKLERFAQNIFSLCILYFKPNLLQDYLKNYQMDQALIEEATTFILTSGVHGKGENNNAHLSGSAKQSLKKNNVVIGRIAYLVKLVFPPFDTMRGMYPVLHKHPYLYPFTFLARWYKIFVKKRKTSFNKIKKLKITHNEIEQRRSLYERFGL
ncbi:MAG: nucleotidyltransferase family protein [Candidatus Izemoplasmatales bacterium]